MRKIELLSPAKDLICGIEAINHGADAVYIGAPRFSARVAAGNEIGDIEKLCNYAHNFGAKVHVALNTILTDNELNECEMLIKQLYEVGVDVLIIQDLGLLTLNLPPLELHASTQMDNRTPEKVKMLENLGFNRVVLARELSISEMAKIRQQTNIELEAFVHGALCVSCSGQCYLSQAAVGRSANRGACAQLCRLPYTLTDANGNVLLHDKHLLSLKDMNRSDYIEDMIMAGISSFKIEGRLKEVEYVKNVTAFYRQKIDSVLEKLNCEKSSFGKITYHFTPNPVKTFYRGKTEYFPSENKNELQQWNTPKSVGQFIGKVEAKKYNYLIIETNEVLNNGDGFLFFDDNNKAKGFRANRVEGNRIFPNEMPKIAVGQEIFRNYDHNFLKFLKGKSAERKIAIDIKFSETDSGFLFNVTDERGCNFNYKVTLEKELALQAEQANQQLQKQLSKLGNTHYFLRNFIKKTENSFFIPISLITQWRNEILSILEEKWQILWHQNRQMFMHLQEFPQLFENETATYLQNVMNLRAKSVYLQLGFSEIAPAFEKQKPTEKVPLMFCKYCIKYAMGYCTKLNPKNVPAEPWYLKSQNLKFTLQFDCKNCEMRLL